MTVKQRISLAVAMLLLLALIAGVIWYRKRPEAAPEGMLVKTDGKPSKVLMCGGEEWQSN